jgi:hypothetical protein
MELELKFAILAKFGNQYSFAREIHIHETKLSQVLHGRRKLSKAEAGSWIKALGCTPDLLNSVLECDHKSWSKDLITGPDIGKSDGLPPKHSIDSDTTGTSKGLGALNNGYRQAHLKRDTPSYQAPLSGPRKKGESMGSNTL